MSLVQLFATHAAPATVPSQANLLQFRREQQVLPSIAGLPRIIRALVTH